MSIPFIIYALPRSRTAWLSALLTYKDWECYHESAIFMRSMDDVKSFFTSNNVGCVETAAAQGHKLIRYIAPDIKEVVILRPVEDVINAILSIDVGVKWDVDILRKNMQYGDRELRRIAENKNTLVVNYHDLDKEQVCASIFEYCLPYKFDKLWWESLKDKNIQVDMKAFFRYYYKNKDAIEKFKKHCKSELIKLRKMGQIKGKIKYA